MSDTKELLRRARRQFPPPEGVMESLVRRRERERRNRRLGTAVLALVVAAVAIGGVIRAFNVAEKPRPADETRREPIVSIPIDRGARSVAVGERSVWVWGGDGVSRVDPVTDDVVASFPGESSAYTGTAIAVGEGAVWAFAGIDERGGAASIIRIDPATNEVVATIPIDQVMHFDGEPGAGLWGITTGLGSVWAGSHFGGAVLRIDPATNGVEVIPVPRPVVHVGAVLDGRVWIAATRVDAGGCSGRGDALIAIDPGSGEVEAYGDWGGCDEVRAGFGSLWADNPIRIDPSTGSIIASFDIQTEGAGAADKAIAVGEGAVWVVVTTLDEEGRPLGSRVLRIDAATNEVVGEVRIPTAAKDAILTIAAGEGAVWVADGGSTLYRIDLGAFDTGTSP